MASLGSRSKLSPSAEGLMRGGISSGRGHVLRVLIGRLHAHRIRHRKAIRKSQHTAIIDPAIWDEAQAQLQAEAANPRRPTGS